MRIRLFLPEVLFINQIVKLTKQQSHYLIKVLRVKINDKIYIFNNSNGEYLANIELINDNIVTVKIFEQNRIFYLVPDISLAFAPVKNAKTEYLSMKATELGVRKIYPVITDRTIVRKINAKRVKANIIEAAEQSDRVDLPELEEINSLNSFLASLTDETLLLADESGDGMTAEDLFKQKKSLGKIIVLIGPEGGFSKIEQEKIKKLKNSYAINLGPRILRADTAIISALAIINNYYGDISLKAKFTL